MSWGPGNSRTHNLTSVCVLVLGLVTGAHDHTQPHSKIRFRKSMAFSFRPNVMLQTEPCSHNCYSSRRDACAPAWLAVQECICVWRYESSPPCDHGKHGEITSCIFDWSASAVAFASSVCRWRPTKDFCQSISSFAFRIGFRPSAMDFALERVLNNQYGSIDDIMFFVGKHRSLRCLTHDLCQLNVKLSYHWI